MISTKLNQFEMFPTGEVLCARDTRLNGEVAVKLLPATFTSDPERLRRFREDANGRAKVLQG